MTLKGPTEGLTIHIVDTMEKLDSMLSELNKKEIIAFDTETNDLNILRKEEYIEEESWFDLDIEDNRVNYTEAFKLVGLSFATDGITSYYIPIGHIRPAQVQLVEGSLKQLPRDVILEKIKPLLETKKIVAHNMKYDYKVMKKYGIKINAYFCTMLGQAVLNQSTPKGLKILTKIYLRRQPLTLKETTDGTEVYNLSEVPVEEAAKYAGPDASNCYGIFEVIRKGINAVEQLRYIMKLEMDVMHAIIEMEEQGLLLDETQIEEIAKKLDADIIKSKEALDSKYEEMAGTDILLTGSKFDPLTPSHIRSALYDVGKSPLKKGKIVPSVTKVNGNYKVVVPIEDSSRMQMEQIAEKAGNRHELRDFIGLVLQLRSLQKLRSSYTYNLLSLRSPDGKLHPEFNQGSVRTGRLAGRNPNTMNLPSRDDEYDIRKMFHAPEGYVFVGADYDTMEMRIAAALSGDTELINIVLGKKKLRDLNTGKNYDNVVSARKDDNGEYIVLSNDTPVDIHCYTVFSTTKTAYEDITKEQRSQLKPVGFGILYGRTQYGLAMALKIDPPTAQGYIDKWFESYPKVKALLGKVKQAILLNGYVTTYHGRRRYFEGNIRKMPQEERLKAYSENNPEIIAQVRQLTNTVIQGTAADICKIAMVNIRNLANNTKVFAPLIIQIHDEIVVMCKEEDRFKVADMLEQAMLFNIPYSYRDPETNEEKWDYVPISSSARATKTLSKGDKNLL